MGNSGRKILKSGTVIAILAASLLLFPQVVWSIKALNSAAWYFFVEHGGNRAREESGRPRGGEDVLPGDVQVMISLLRRYGVPDFRFSEGIGAVELTKQRLVEGAYPIRYSPFSHYILYYDSETVAPGARVIDGDEGVSLAYRP